MISLTLLVLAADPLPLSLDMMTVERARSLHGQQVTVSLIPAKPSYTLKGQTIVGADDLPDGVERGIHLKGHRFDVKEGTRIEAKGKLRVIEHRGAFVGMVFVPPWTEIRVEEGK